MACVRRSVRIGVTIATDRGCDDGEVRGDVGSCGTLRNWGILDGSGIAVGVAVRPSRCAVVARGARVRRSSRAARARPRVEPATRAPRRRARATRASSQPRSSPSDVLDRTLDAVVALPGVDAALVAIGDDGDDAADDARDRADRGRDRANAAPDAEPPRPARARGRLPLPARRRGRASAKLPRCRADRRAARRGRDDRLAGRDQPLGLDRASRRRRRTRSRASPAGPGPAISNALRFVEAREQAELDSLTGLHNRRALLRVPRPRDRPRPPLRALRLADRVRPRRLQADQRPDRPPRRRRRARRGRRARPQRRPRDRHPVPRRRRRVRGDPARVEPRRRRAARRPDRDRDPRRRRSRRSARSRSPPASPSCGPRTRAADLFKRADHALYRAKNAGKARVVAS